MSSLHSQAGKDKEAMEALELIFAYSYGCCAFKHVIYGDQPEIPDGMPNSVNPLPLEFFVNSRCPSAPTAVEVKAVEIDLGEATKDPKEGVIAEE